MESRGPFINSSVCSPMQCGQLCLIYLASIMHTGQCRGAKGRKRYTEKWRVDGVFAEWEQEWRKEKERKWATQREGQSLCLGNLIVQLMISQSLFSFYSVTCTKTAVRTNFFWCLSVSECRHIKSFQCLIGSFVHVMNWYQGAKESNSQFAAAEFVWMHLFYIKPHCVLVQYEQASIHEGLFIIHPH